MVQIQKCEKFLKDETFICLLMLFLTGLMDVKVYDNTTEMLPEDPSADAICMRSSNDSYCQMAGKWSIVSFMSSPAYDVFLSKLIRLTRRCSLINVLF